MHRTWFKVMASVSLGGAAAPVLAAEVRLDNVARSGQPAPGIDGSAFASFGESIYRKFINNAGQIAFAANVSNATQADDSGIWIGDGDGLTLVVREGQPVAALGPDIVLASIPRVLGIADNGAVLFRSSLAGNVLPTNNEAILIAQQGSVLPVARRGLQAPGRPAGIVYTQFLDAVMSPLGQVAFTAGTNSGNAIWSFQNNEATLVAAVGDPAPGFPQGTSYMRLVLGRTIGSTGDFGFHATLTGAAASYAMYRYANAQVEPVLSTGDAAPGLPQDIAIAYIPPTAPAISTDGGIVFATALSGPGITFGNDTALWADGGDDAVALVAREGDPAPGASPGSVFFGSDFARQHATDGAFTMFTSQTTGTPDSNGLWVRDPGGLTLLVRGGSPAPGAGPGAAFASFTAVSDANYPPHIAINAAGRLAFTAMISGPGITQLNNMGVWATDPQRRIRKLVRTGDVLEVSPGVTRTITTVHDAEVNAIGQFATAVNFAQDAALLIGTIGCAGDGCAGVDLADDDCVIGLSDLTALLAEFGNAGPNLNADVDRDGAVDLDDLAALLVAFGTDCR